MDGRVIQKTVAGGAMGLLITGCAAPGRQMPLPEVCPLGAEYPAVGRTEPAGSSTTDDASSAPTGRLTLEQALAAALLWNPELAAQSHEVRGAEARLSQAGVLPNPELLFEVEEYDRDGEGFDSAETSVALAQAIELGGKRRRRMRLAEARGELAGWAYERKRLDVFDETSDRFVEVVAAQERLKLTRSAVDLARKTSEAVGERVKAGKEPRLQSSKSEAELEMARLEALTAEQTLGVARKMLAATWGADSAAFDTAEGSLDHVLDSIPSLEALRSRLGRSPELARWGAELRLRHAALASEKASRIPDLEASVGYQQFEEDGTDALAFGVGMPLPLFDRNRGNIAAAQHELAKAERERSATVLALGSQLAEAHASLTAAHQRAGSLRSKVVPAMEQAYQAALEGYRQGKFGFLDMLDAQRSLYEAQASLVDALRDYHVALIGIQRITGTGIEELMTIEQENRT